MGTNIPKKNTSKPPAKPSPSKSKGNIGGLVVLTDLVSKFGLRGTVVIVILFIFVFKGKLNKIMSHINNKCPQEGIYY